MIAEACQAFSPAVSVMDAMQVFVSEGPERGELAAPGVIAASRDRIALDKAIEALRRAVARTPSRTGLALLGRAQLQAGDIPAAWRSLQQATAVLPVDPESLGDLATAAERLGRLAAAREALVKQATLVGDAGPSRARADRAERIATLLLRLGDRQAAIDWFSRALAATPDDRTLSARVARLKAS